MSTISSNGPPLRCRTLRQSSSGSSAKASSVVASTTIHDASSSSSSSCPLAPARVAREQAQPADRQVLRLGLRRHEPERLHDRRRRVLDVVELGEHHERLRLDRAADEDRLVRAGQPCERRHRGHGRHGRRAAEHEAHRAVLVVVRDQDDRLAEVRVVESRRRDEQLSLERVHLLEMPPSRRRQTCAGCVWRRPGDAPRRARRRSGLRAPSSPCARAASRRSGPSRRAPGLRGRSRRSAPSRRRT